MIFSYNAAERFILDGIDVPLAGGELTLLTGVENNLFGLIGGIIAGLFPIEAGEPLPQIEDLIAAFTGELRVSQGRIPERASYLGPDPERHILFSRVDEELYARTGTRENAARVLGLFGLGEDLAGRRISTLSGGEKMKLALGIVFSNPVDCIVLHGVLPWLDRRGRTLLIARIREELDRGTSIVVLEQELNELRPIARHLLHFDGEKLSVFREAHLVRPRARIDELAGAIREEPLIRSRNGQRGRRTILRFSRVGFHYEREGTGRFSLKNVDFSLQASGVYGMVGDNGTGKSTIARLILRIIHPEEGSIELLGRGLQLYRREELARLICFAGQFPEQYITQSNVEQYKQRAAKSENDISARLLQKLFPGRNPYPVSLLTPLQLKLLLIVSSVHRMSKLVILDEPTWGIDLFGEATLLETLLDILREVEEVTFLIISHDLEFIRRLNAELLLVREGSVTYFGEGTGGGYDVLQEARRP
jgi:ABC-type multidrug transport system ATPase subunit